MNRIRANVESLVSRRAIDNVNRAATFVTVADGDPSEVNSLHLRQVASENVLAADNAIRDADFAVQVSYLTRARILVNSSSSVLQPVNAQSWVGDSAHCETDRAEGCDPPLSSVSFDIGSVVGP